jgi:hypothetical protein
MVTGTSEGYNIRMYSELNIRKYINTLPFWRRILAKHFERYKVSKEEYDKWFVDNLFKQ